MKQFATHTNKATIDPSASNSLSVLTLAELLALQNDPLDWLLDDLIPGGGLAILAGMPSSGKTFLALDLALAVTTCGRAWGRELTAASPALYVDLENAPQMLSERMRALLNGRNLTPAEKLHFILGQPLSLTDPADVAQLGTAIAATEARLIVFDSLVRFMGGADENDAGNVAQAMGNLRSLANAHACAVLLIHHLRKSTGVTAGAALESVRGSGDIVAAMDTVIIVNGRGKVTTAKSRWTQTPAPFGFAITSDGEATQIVIGEATETKKRLVACVMETTQTILDRSASSLPKQEIASRIQAEGVVASDRTLDTALANLQQAGHLTVGKKGRKNTYALAKVLS